MKAVRSIEESQDVYPKFRYFYENYANFSEKHLLAIYAEKVQFRDPVHVIHGIEKLQQYFSEISAGLISCRFVFVHEIVTSDQAHITWDMYYRHKKLAKGKELKLRGMSYIKMRKGKVVLHEDCYDLGAMLYENIPLLGGSIKAIKGRLASHER